MVIERLKVKPSSDKRDLMKAKESSSSDLLCN